MSTPKNNTRAKAITHVEQRDLVRRVLVARRRDRVVVELRAHHDDLVEQRHVAKVRRERRTAAAAAAPATAAAARLLLLLRLLLAAHERRQRGVELGEPQLLERARRRLARCQRAARPLHTRELLAVLRREDRAGHSSRALRRDVEHRREAQQLARVDAARRERRVQARRHCWCWCCRHAQERDRVESRFVVSARMGRRIMVANTAHARHAALLRPARLQ